MSLDFVIAGTKFAAPTSLHALVHRQRLHEVLTTGLQYPLTLASAPAGYGKTSLLSEWFLTTRAHRSCAWVSLDASDDEVNRFWLCVFLALQRCAPDLMTPLLSLLQTQRMPPVQDLLSLLINRLLEEPEARYVLVIDDYHLMTAPAIHQSLTSLIERLPPQLCLYLSTRIDPPLPLHRLRARGQLLEVRVHHLQCTPSEASAFLQEVMGLALTNEEVEAITQRTEGWLVGVQLIALSLQGQARLSDVLTRASGTQRSILDYFTEEVLRQQPERLQTFLLISSLLDQFCVPLCDALWEEGQSQQMLEHLERLHLFVVALDAQGTWYRYHHLFAEALRRRLHQSTSQEQIEALYGKASAWYAEQGLPHEAMHYAVRSRDWHHVIALLGRFIRDLQGRPGSIHMMEQWIEQLPADLFSQDPRLGLFAAWLWYSWGDFRTAEGWLDRTESALAQMPEGNTRGQLFAETLAFRAVIKGFYGNVQEIIALSEQAKQLLDDDNSYVRALLHNAQALAFLARGEASALWQALQEAMAAYEQAGVMVIASCLSCIASSYLLMLGQLKQAEQELALLALEPWEQPLARGLLAASQAALLYEQNQLEQAFDQAQQAVHLLEQAGSMLLVDRAYVVLMQIFLARQQFDDASEILQRLLTLPTYRDNRYAQTWCLSGLQVRLWLSMGKQDVAVQWRMRSQQHVPLPSVFAQEREAVAGVRVLLAERRSEEARHLLATWLPRARLTERREQVLEMCLLEALACQQMRQEQQALQALEEALLIGEPEGYLRHFLDEGPHLVPLLKRSLEQHRRPYVDRLVEAFLQEEKSRHEKSGPPSSAHQQALIDPLTSREQEVLEWLSQGASNQEIAQALVIAPNTVKRHVQAILAKLGVRNRTQAVARAQQLDLLPQKAD
ncbi:LuxR family transcriptional regulator [Reticulibacter mediterranei]|uniref:LuxR family transcriptional regulator n=1 Tax=Reticulibacter mediterranei TaxID=2778369 RepID=A0A8J3IXS6_9CHLR|nr:LuxR C-terminal-related transcriptional regulator [Reticulibacter mediterranei]GHO99874.1 LuxR family transcriptional regulator [Reticulibacter mediterranei]